MTPTKPTAQNSRTAPPPVIQTAMPPHDTEAEEAVIAAMMTPEGSSYIAALASKLTADDFFREKNAWVFTAVIELWERSTEANMITVAHELAKHDRLEQVGGMTYLADVIRRLPAVSGAIWYADIVAQAAQKRRLIQSLQGMQNEAWDPVRDPEEIIASGVETLLGLAGTSRRTMTIDAKGAMAGLKNELADWLEDPSAMRGTLTGWAALDELTRGLQRGRVYTAMGDTSVGKSFLADWLALNMAKRGEPVGLFSSEMNWKEVVRRMVFMEAGIDPVEIEQSGETLGPQLDAVMAAMERIEKMPLYICDRSKPPLSLIVAEARRWQAQHGVVGVFIDHLQHVTVPGKEGREVIEEVTSTTKSLAQNHDIWVWQISHITRQSGKDGDLTIHSGKGASSIEQDSDMVMLLEPVGPNGTTWMTLNTAQANAQSSHGFQYVRLRVEKGRAGGKGWDVRKLDWRKGGQWVPLQERK